MNQLVRTSLLILSFLMGLVAIVPAQTVDVTKVLADPKTYTFSDNKHTVKTYIYETLEAQTTCCGPARMYLEVKIDPSGYVLNVKPLTGQTQECYAKSVQDIVKNIKWNAQGFTAAKSIYFEIKPSIECGEGKNNAYTQVSIFNNEKVDANGVPLNYASSTGISASAAAGTSGTPSVPAAEGGTPAEEAVAANTGTNEDGNEAEEGGKEGGLPTPPGTKPKTSTSEPASGSVATGVPDKTRSSANAEMETALEMAKKDREAQEAEIQRLKDELAAAKEAEEQAAREKEEVAKRAEQEAEEARLAEQRAKDEERKRLREERERERERLAAERDGGDRRDDRDRRDGGFRDVDYGDNGRGDDRDRYADNRDQDPPRQMTEVERRQKESDDIRREIEELNRRMRDADNSERESQRNRERLANDLIRLEERRLKAEAAIAEAREKEELERINQSIRQAEEQQREKDRLVQEKMREMERMKSDLERAVADLERFEQEAAEKAAEKATKEAEIEQAQAERNAEMEAKLATMRLESGDPDAVAEGVQQPFTGNDDVSRQLEILRQQILILTQQINDLRNGGGGFTGARLADNGSPRGKSPAPKRRASGSNGDFKSAAANRDWEKLKSIDDILDPNRTEEYPENTFETVSEPAPGQEKAAANSPGNPEHMNIAGPKFTKPVYTGGVTAMKQFVADELKKNSVCGLAHTAFEVTIDGSGKVLAHNVLAVNNQNLLLYLPAIINRMQFQATGSGLPVRAVYELKADITCEGVEKVDLNSVPNMIRN